ncbi:MAG TPA: rhodanese-like domain-containing protein [Puia sp.]|nr:rhodanese-like domain-containing protein [Puia sp.]
MTKSTNISEAIRQRLHSLFDLFFGEAGFIHELPEVSRPYFMHKLCHETEASDVHTDMEDGMDNFLVIDARSHESFTREHIPGAINIPHKHMNLETTAFLPKDKVMVVYCDGIGCNASTDGHPSPGNIIPANRRYT